MKQIDELIERLEKATGSDREIDALLALGVAGWSHERRKGDRYEYWRDPDDISPHSTYHPRRELPRYTASIDAALALVERRGLAFDGILDDALSDVVERALERADVGGDNHPRLSELPIAILIALLRALRSISEDGK